MHRRVKWTPAAILLLVSGACGAQVLSPPEIADLDLRELQQKHLAELKTVATAIAAHQFPYHFYFSRKLDLTEDQERFSDQRSVQFARFQNRIVLQITANYFASYSAELMKKEDRARKTFDDVMLPMLRAEVPVMRGEQAIQSFALEVSHHVRKKTLGVPVERAENVVLVIPREAAVRLASATTSEDREIALEQAMTFLDGQPISLWAAQGEGAVVSSAATAARVVAPTPAPAVQKLAPPVVAAMPPPAAPSDASPGTLKNFQATWQETLNRIVRDMDSTARFVGYAPPSFIPFHKGAYLQLSITTPLPAGAAGSRYRLAAMAFDEHVARLIRPLLAYFKDDPKFDGIDFSTSIRLEGAPPDSTGTLAVEYIFGLPALRAYEQYDCSGQQLIDSGFVLINGERVSLDLQSAEAPSPK